MQNDTEVDVDMGFIQEQNNSQLAIIAAEMAEEYQSNKVLTALTELDGEDFVLQVSLNNALKVVFSLS
jgi:hypothetical protein